MTANNTKERINSKNYEEALPYRMELVHSSNIDTTTYQRKIRKKKVDRIVAEFNERIANEPKLSHRDGKYYVFDGQHTIAARKKRNGGNDLDIVCKVFYDLTEEDEALLFAAQTGVSSKPSPGVTLRAKEIGKDAETLAFIKANESLDIQPSYSDAHGKYRLRCINTAYQEYCKVGEKRYKEAMKIIVDAWKGAPSSFVLEVIVAMCSFVKIYHGDYDRKKLAKKLSFTNPYDIVKAARTIGDDGGKKKALSVILEAYNNENTVDPLGVKF